MKTRLLVAATLVSMSWGQSVSLGGFSAKGSVARLGEKQGVLHVERAGVHINGSTSALPPVGWFGGQRLWDVQCNWYQIETVAPMAPTQAKRLAGAATLTVSATSGALDGMLIHVEGLVGGFTALNGFFIVSSHTSTSVSYSNVGADVAQAAASGVIRSYDFSCLDSRLQSAKTQGEEVMATLAKTPAFSANNYSSNFSEAVNCPATSPGVCYPPADLNADGTGTNLAYRTFVTAFVTHVNGLNPSVYAVPRYFEVWNEINAPLFWNGTNAQLIRLTDDLNCILRGRAADVIHATATTCGADTGFWQAGMLPSAKVLTPDTSNPFTATYLSYMQTAGATDNADIITVHGYGFPGRQAAISTLTRSGVTVTANATAHNLLQGQWILMYGAAPADFNGAVQIVTAATNSFTYLLAGASASGTGGFAHNGADEVRDQILYTRSQLLAQDLNKKFWVTEGQWGQTTGSTDPDTRIGWAPRWYANLWAAGVDRAFWYGWDFTNQSGVMWSATTAAGSLPCDAAHFDSPCLPATGFVNSNGIAWNAFRKLTLNTVMTQVCARTAAASPVNTCEFTRPNGSKILMVWDEAQDAYTPGTATFSNYTVDPRFSGYYDWDGSYHTIVGSTLPIGAKAIYLEQKAM